jgi:hypothetical protein
MTAAFTMYILMVFYAVIAGLAAYERKYALCFYYLFALGISFCVLRMNK